MKSKTKENGGMRILLNNISINKLPIDTYKNKVYKMILPPDVPFLVH
jgi:hypothetical protein